MICKEEREMELFQRNMQGYDAYDARKVNYSCVYSAYILKPVLSGRNF